MKMHGRGVYGLTMYTKLCLSSMELDRGTTELYIGKSGTHFDASNVDIVLCSTQHSIIKQDSTPRSDGPWRSPHVCRKSACQKLVPDSDVRA